MFVINQPTQSAETANARIWSGWSSFGLTFVGFNIAWNSSNSEGLLGGRGAAAAGLLMMVAGLPLAWVGLKGDRSARVGAWIALAIDGIPVAFLALYVVGKLLASLGLYP